MTALSTATLVTFIMTRDRKAAERYYDDVLQLPRGKPDDFAAVYDLAGTILRITEIPDFVAGAHPALGWRVDDIVATAIDLRSRGVAFKQYPGLDLDEHGIWTSPDGSARVAWFDDPDGNLLSLFESARN